MPRHIKVKAFPGAQSEFVRKTRADSYDIGFRERPILGRGNERVRSLLAGELGLEEKMVRIISGRRSRHKIVQIKDYD